MASPLAFNHLRIHLRAAQPARLPPFPGPTLRGGLGHVLRRLVCVTHMATCDPCFLRHTCAFPVLFQPYAPPDHPHAGRYTQMPPPFVLRVPLSAGTLHRGGRPSPVELAAGEDLAVELILFGPATHHAPYYIYAFMRLAWQGIGRRGQQFDVVRVEVWHRGQWVPASPDDMHTLHLPPPTPLADYLPLFRLPDPRRLRLTFHAPVRLDLDRDLVYPVEFVHLVRALLQRWRALEACYGPIAAKPLEPAQARELLERARAVRREEDRTRWLDLSRYSTRQRRRLKMGGAVGEVTYVADDFTPFLPLLVFGQVLHVGKLTSMGFGHLEVSWHER